MALPEPFRRKQQADDRMAEVVSEKVVPMEAYKSARREQQLTRRLCEAYRKPSKGGTR